MNDPVDLKSSSLPTLRSERLEFSIHTGWLLTGGILWSYVLQQTDTGLPPLALNLLLFTCCLGYLVIYSKYPFRFSLSRGDAKAFGLFFVINIVLHGFGLFYSLGGDELYHAERSAFVLTYLRDVAAQLPPLSVGDYRNSAWLRFDPRHYAVIDLWRAISIILIILTLGCIASWRALSRWIELPERVRTLVLLIAIFLGTLWVGRYAALPVENHPPLRIFPLFVGQLVFGLNACAFRIPGVIVSSFISFCIFKFLERSAPEQPVWWRGFVSALPMFIPIVFYVSEAVEPSVYAFGAWVLVLIASLSYLRSKDVVYLERAGVIAGLATLLRQPAVLLWSIIGVLVLVEVIRRRAVPLMELSRICAPAAISVPYFLTVRRLGHAATPEPGSPVGHVVDSILSGIGPMAIAHTTTIPWIILVCLALVVVVRRGARAELLLFAFFIPAYSVYHIIWSYLWGLGRYQAEYVAPLMVLTFVLLCELSTKRQRAFFTALGTLAIISTFEVSSNLSLDTTYAQWPKMRITSSANFPYREALGAMKREDPSTRFVLLGGTPWYGSMVLWLAGFSFTETSQWRANQDAFDVTIATKPTLQSAAEFLKTRGVDTIIVQGGTRREQQHRNDPVAALISQLETDARTPSGPFRQIHEFRGEHGGILSVYSAMPGL